MQSEFRKLYTEAGERLANDPAAIPWDVYPRPHLRRREWLNLNGEWDFSAESGKPCGKIRVPFCVESLLAWHRGSRFYPIGYGEKLLYSRSFSVPEAWRERRVLLHLGAVSRICSVLVNGRELARGDSAYFPISCDITDSLIEGGNLLEVVCVNDLDPRYPYGKQKLKRGGMWYTPCSGIWQTVWLEPVPEGYVRDIRCVCDENGADIFVDGVSEGEIIFGGKSRALVNGFCRIEPEDPRLWSPDEPNLYGFTVRSGMDEAESYFALRSVGIGCADGTARILLNGRPYFFNGLLDQGYYSDGLWTPADPGEYERDILRMKSLGFNMLRKHIKIEPELFYYYCDKLGMAVFQDMVNNGRYSFLRDTLLPTAGVTKLNDRLLNRDQAARRVFEDSMLKTVSLLGSHPSIVLWTVFNEGWGQFESDRMYRIIKNADPSRPVDSASGWFCGGSTDVESLHIYFKKLRPGKRKDKPLVISEFGGYVLKLPGHSFNLKKTYGYKILKDKKEYSAALKALYSGELAPLVRSGLSAAVYTQVSDVEDETNGILTFDRRVMKVSPEDGIFEV